MRFFKILFFIFVNSHWTHGTSCVNNPYYIGDRTRSYLDEVKIQPYTGSVATLKHYKKNTLCSSKIYKKLSLTASKYLSYSFSIIYNHLLLLLCYVKIYWASSKKKNIHINVFLSCYLSYKQFFYYTLVAPPCGFI